ncbi:molybdopterin cofactor-binding domain-containing protein [Haloechinothrix sp. LS1_15]|uniref:molybdopterin cofactor-binding domain-containing protein n=1 Tax=Haloechinothrix sp. LS1_15 TaxID=2652248 RepID=UPI002945F96F|nr:molybdopterin cofactor-binding domain-containing protein [Haloechinothrix sp. LS1_15]MDV6014083.1 xanthine dehydrogenase family protein molybdopterin-binding subunit [Haloechinothrix sp. LS1_15]
MAIPARRSGEHAEPPHDRGSPEGVGRRRFLTYLVAAPVLTVAAKVGFDVVSGAGGQAQALPKPPQLADIKDLGDILALANAPTQENVKLEVGEDSIVRLFLHRTEVGQGIATACGMMVAEEMDIPLSQVEVPLRDADPELLFNQLTGGSATIRHLYGPVRRAAARARGRMAAAAAQRWGVDTGEVAFADGMLVGPDGRAESLGALTAAAANPDLPDPGAEPKPESEQELIGKPTGRIDARRLVTGQHEYTLDIDVPGALPTMVRHAPTIQGTPKSVANAGEVKSMPGVVDVVTIPTGVAVVAETFGQAEDATKALEVSWNAGSVDDMSDEDVEARLKNETLPLTVPDLGTSMDFEFFWHFVSHAPMETNCAVADVRDDHATIWSGLKIPIIAKQDIAEAVGLPQDRVDVHVVQSGGSFGRRLFHDAALEAAHVSKAIGKPVKLMWGRVDDTRHGRARPASFNRARVTRLGNEIVSYEYRMTQIEASAEHGLGEHITAAGARFANYPWSQSIFHAVVHCPYEFGVVNQLLHEPLDIKFNTGSWRSPYSSVVRTTEEIIVDEVAAELGKDPYEFRRQFVGSDRKRTVLDTVAEAAEWGKRMPSGHAQGMGFHEEYNSMCAFVVEIDATDPGNPRVYRATCAVDVGHPINPKGLEAMMHGGINDGIATVLQAGLHIRDGLPLESSFGDFRYTRQQHFPRDVNVIVLPSHTTDLGGAGELGVAGAAGAVANAYARATGTKPRRFPINFDVDFEPVPR